jgi:hypothetical protein
MNNTSDNNSKNKIHLTGYSSQSNELKRPQLKPLPEEPNLLAEFVYFFIQNDYLKSTIETQKLKNNLNTLKADEFNVITNAVEKLISLQSKSADAALNEGRANLLNSCIANIDKLSDKSLRYILMSYANPTIATTQQDKEINEELQEQEVRKQTLLNNDLEDKIKENKSGL